MNRKGFANVMLIVIIPIIGALIIGGGAFAYFNYFQSPEKIVQKMTAELTQIKFLEYSGEIRAETNAKNLLGWGGNFLQPTQPTPNQKTGNFSINFNGISDVNDSNNPKGLFTINIKTDILTSPAQEETSFELEIRIINRTVYIKLNNLPNLGFFDLSPAANQWIKIDAEALTKQFELGKIEEWPKKTQQKQELSTEQIEKLKTAVQQVRIFKITRKLIGEKIEGINTYHYKFIIDKEEIKKLFTDISQIIQNKTLTEKELADFDKGLEAIELPEGEIWIGKKDLLLYKILLSSKIKETGGPKITGKFTIILVFKNYNKPAQINIPTPIKNLEEILGKLFSKFFNDGRSKGSQPNIQLKTSQKIKPAINLNGLWESNEGPIVDINHGNGQITAAFHKLVSPSHFSPGDHAFTATLKNGRLEGKRATKAEYPKCPQLFEMAPFSATISEDGKSINGQALFCNYFINSCKYTGECVWDSISYTKIEK